MTNSTLTSLAMLKVRIDQGDDYLGYLRPFVLQVLIDNKNKPITDDSVKNYILSDFGMELPARTIQVVLRRLSKEHLLKKINGVYEVRAELPHPRIDAEKANAERHINAVLSGLRDFSISTRHPLVSDSEADTAVRAFLSQFGIQCLRAYLRGTTIPKIEGNYDVEIVLVSQYILELQKINPERFESFIIVAKGHMLANALLCPDLQNLPKTYDRVTFYLDTPLIIRLLGLEGGAKKDSTRELIDLLSSLGGTVGVFEHTCHEVEKVIKSAANYIDSVNGHSEIVMESRKQGISKSDLLVMVGQVQDKLSNARVEIIATPRYMTEFQIDELEFEKIIDKELHYSNPQAKTYDINSVRSIYVIRKNTSPQNIEKCKAVFVTSNTAFARAAFLYGGKHNESREISTVITDFSLANMAWLKAPMGAPLIPMREVLAFSYAAIQPSKSMWDKFLLEIDKLENRNSISAIDHQLLRSSHLVQSELSTLTLGDEEALTTETISEILGRVKKEFKREGNDMLIAEKEAHRKTQNELISKRNENNQIQKRVFWRCERKAKWISAMISLGIIAFLILGVICSFGVEIKISTLAWTSRIASTVAFIFTLGNLFFGTTMKNIYSSIHRRFRLWLLKRECSALGIDIVAYEQGEA